MAEYVAFSEKAISRTTRRSSGEAVEGFELAPGQARERPAHGLGAACELVEEGGGGAHRARSGSGVVTGCADGVGGTEQSCDLRRELLVGRRLAHDAARSRGRVEDRRTRAPSTPRSACTATTRRLR